MASSPTLSISWSIPSPSSAGDGEPGGSGGGASGGNYGEKGTAPAGTVNTGGGGGGGGGTEYVLAGYGGAGGKGTVIIAYPDSYDDLTSVDVGLTVNGSTGNTTPNTDRSGYKVYKFTSGTGNIQF